MAGIWRDGCWRSSDGLRLHYRDYSGAADRAPILCIPGLTRNARDFAAVAARLAGPRRLIVVDLRGRGESDRTGDPSDYQPLVYLADMLALIEALALPPVVLFGTSLGGLIAMLLAATARERLAGVLLNDIGPVVEPAGLVRIGSYVGGNTSWPDMAAAAAAQAALHGHAHPDYREADWLDMAQRLCRVERDGRVVPDYDPAIAHAFALPPPEPPVDLWPAFEALRGAPGLAVRGALSDILSPGTAAEMVRRVPEMALVEVPATGHAPTLTEPPAMAAIDQLLRRIDRTD